MFYGTINHNGYKSHILITEVRSSRLWRKDFCRQESEQNKLFTIFQILHFQYSTNIVLNDVLQRPVMYTSFQNCLCALKFCRKICYFPPNSISWMLLCFIVDLYHHSDEILHFQEKFVSWGLLRCHGCAFPTRANKSNRRTIWSLTSVILLKQRDYSNDLLIDFRKPDEVTLNYYYPLLQKLIW